MFEATVSEGVCRLARGGARWLATGPDGGYAAADGALNVSVPREFDRTDLESYVARRRERAGFPGDGPALLTGVDVAHARGSRSGDVTVVATAGLSNPATLAVADSTPAGGGRPNAPAGPADEESDDGSPPPGTVNLLVGTTRSLQDGTLATLLATAVEAKTATLDALAGFTGTTSDAVAVGCAPAGEPAAFAGSATPLGEATRACVRDAIRASLDARYADREWPAAVADAAHGTVTTGETTAFRP